MVKRTVCSALVLLALGVTVMAQSTYLGARPSPESTDAVLVLRHFTIATGEGYGTVPHVYTIEVKRALGKLASVGVVGRAGGTTSLIGPSGVRLTTSEVTYNALDLLRIQVFRGRDFTEEDTRSGKPVAILSHASWTREFKSAPDIIGSTLRRVTGNQLFEDVTIVGILPPGVFATTPELDFNADVLVLSPDRLEDETVHSGWYAPILRLAPGVTVAQADAIVARAVASIHRGGAASPEMGLRLETLRR